MLPDRVSNPGPLTYESSALPTALRGLACDNERLCTTEHTVGKIFASSILNPGPQYQHASG